MNANQEIISEQIIERICKCGWKAYLTGGAVRDLFRGENPADFDIVTNCEPEDLQLIFPDKKVKMVGASFLVTLIEDIEVATYRSDRNVGPGRHNCQTSVCETIDEDLARRDFTFNALAVCPYSGEVIDPFKGLEDLKKQIVKFVGEPDARIYEDEQRMIRAARFTSLIEGQLEESSAAAIRKNAGLIQNVAPERIRLDILKAMKYRKPSIFFRVLHDTGILPLILPEMDELFGHTGGEYHGETLEEHSFLTGDALPPCNPILRLVGYLHDIGKVPSFAFHKDGSFIDHEHLGAEMIEGIFKRFKFTNEEIEIAKGLVTLHMRSMDALASGKAVRRLLSKFAEMKVTWRDWLLLKIADKNANLKQSKPVDIKKLCLKIHEAKKSMNGGDSLKVVDLALDGHDVMQEFDLKPGPVVGKILKALLEIVLDDPEVNSKENLLEIAKKVYHEQCSGLSNATESNPASIIPEGEHPL